MKKRDLILIVAILAVALLLLGIVALTRKEGAYVVVRVDGEEVARYSLAEDGEYSLNGGTNILRIEGGQAYLTYADCPDHLCVKQGRVHSTGEVITCLPNKLTVTVYGAESDVELVG